MRQFIKRVLGGLALIEIIGLVLLAVFAGIGIMFLEIGASFVLGVILLRTLGRREPHPAEAIGGRGVGMMLSGGARFFSAIFLMAPGMITDLLGLLLLIPGLSGLMKRTAGKVAAKRMGVAGGFAGQGAPFGGMPMDPEAFFRQAGYDMGDTADGGAPDEIIVEARVKEPDED